MSRSGETELIFQISEPEFRLALSMSRNYVWNFIYLKKMDIHVLIDFQMLGGCQCILSKSNYLCVTSINLNE